MKTVTEKYRAIKSGQITEAEFVRQMRLTHPEHITQFNGFADTIQILKNKGLLFEEKEYVTVNMSDDSIRRGLRYELQAMNLDPAGKVSSDDLDKAKQKAIANVKKDPLHYYNLLSGESSKVDKHDKPVEVKKGNHKDTHNGLKKAELKEEVIAEGTRALVGYLAGDRLTTAYNHYDGYPSHLGKALEAHYNNDEAAKDLALKGYISSMDADTGEVKSTHNDPPKKIKLPEDDEEMAREVAEQIDGMGADYGYIWDDRANRWVTIKNTGIRSMIDQIMDKMGEYAEVQEAEVEEVIELPTLKETLGGIVAFLKSKGAGNESIKDFIKMHKDDIQGMDMDSVEDEYNNFISVNTDYVDETDAYDNDEETQDMIDKMRKDGKDADDFIDEKEGKLNEEGVEDANYPIDKAFKKYGIDMSKDVIVAEMDGGTAGLGGGQLSLEDAEPAVVVAKRLEKHRLAAIAEHQSENPDGDFPVNYEDGFYGDYTPKGTEHKLTYSENEGTMWDIFQAPSGVSEKKVNEDVDYHIELLVPEVAFDVESGNLADSPYEFGTEDEIEDGDVDVTTYTDGDELDEFVFGRSYKQAKHFEKTYPGLFKVVTKLSEKKGKDHDGDGDIDGDDYKAAKDKAIKKAMGKDKAMKENLKAIITKVLEEDQINEAATNVLAAFGDDYAGFDGMKSAINALENIVTDIEQYYDKTRAKIQKVYDTLAEIRNEEGLKVGGFLAPAVEQAFNRDLRPVVKHGFTKGLDMPQVKKLASPGMAQETEAPKQTVFGLNEKKKK